MIGRPENWTIGITSTGFQTHVIVKQTNFEGWSLCGFPEAERSASASAHMRLLAVRNSSKVAVTCTKCRAHLRDLGTRIEELLHE